MCIYTFASIFREGVVVASGDRVRVLVLRTKTSRVRAEQRGQVTRYNFVVQVGGDVAWRAKSCGDGDGIEARQCIHLGDEFTASEARASSAEVHVRAQWTWRGDPGAMRSPRLARWYCV